MKKLYFLLASIFAVFSFSAFSQNVAINNTGAQADSSAILDVQSNSKGVLFPRMTDSQRMAIHSPATGLIVYQTNAASGFYFNSGTPSAPAWILLAKNNILPDVTTGSDTTITINILADSIAKINLKGSATDKDGTIKGYLWSEVSGPNTPVITSAGSASASAIGVINGTYIFQLMATDNSGATAVRQMSVTVIVHRRMVLRPAPNPDEVHLAVNHNGNASDQTAPEFGATSWTLDGDPATTRGIFKFDLSTIPADAIILSAKLTLYSDTTPINGDMVHANYGTNNSMLLQKVISNWDNTITWYNQPSTDNTSQIVIPHTDEPFLDLKDIDVTAMVKTMHPNANNGFLIRLQNESPYNSRIFCSSKYAVAAKHPKLEIQYSR